MSTPSDDAVSSGALKSIVVAVVIALLAGGSAPWWWNKVFPEQRRLPRQPKNSSYMGDLEPATNRQGGDLYSLGIVVNSAQECSDLCAADDNCKAMTFVKHPNSNGGECWKKGSVPSPSGNPYMVSSVKHYQKQ
jgi:PAN domain-containing protein